MCTRHPDWQSAKITAYVPDVEGTHIAADTDRVKQLLAAARIKADVVGVDQSPAAFTTALGGATLALAPLRREI